MADTQNPQDQNTIDTLRAELKKLASQLENVVKSVEHRKDETASDISGKLAKELEQIRAYASSHAHKVYDAGHAGIDEVGEQVRRNPLASLLIAFGAGCVISCLFRNLK